SARRKPVSRAGPDEGANRVPPAQQVEDEGSADVTRPTRHEDIGAFEHSREPTLELARSLKAAGRCERRTLADGCISEALAPEALQGHRGPAREARAWRPRERSGCRGGDRRAG